MHPDPSLMPMRRDETRRTESTSTNSTVIHRGVAWFWRRREWLAIAVVLLIASLAHGVNMFAFPYVENDEGTYMAQAWAVVELGQLAPYTYWYDHAPLGWIQLAGWSVMTGGFDRFGSAIVTGRMLMLLMQVISTFMVYRIARSVGQGPTPAIIAALLFATSALGIYYHRRILLDNIATFWMLLSIVTLVSRRPPLKMVWISAAALAVSILSKEVTAVLVPVMAVLVVIQADRIHRWFALVGWTAIVSSIVSLYPLMAILKGELLPPASGFGGAAEHVSLIGTLQFQAARGKDGGAFDSTSGFWREASGWIRDEPFLVIAGTLCGILSVTSMRQRPLAGIIGLLTLALWAFLGRGGEVIVFYLLPLLPLLALNVGLVAGRCVDAAVACLRRGSTLGRSLTWIPNVGAIALCLSGTLWGFGHAGFLNNDPMTMWKNEQALAVQQAAEYIQDNVPPSSVLVIDQSMWMDLHHVGMNIAPFTNSHYYWKVESDPEIREELLRNDWRNIDYIITTPQLLYDSERVGMTLVLDALDHSSVVAHFDTGGWPIDIRQVQH